MLTCVHINLGGVFLARQTINPSDDRALVIGSLEHGGSTEIVSNTEDLLEDRGTDSVLVLVGTGAPNQVFGAHRQGVRFVAGSPRHLAKGVLHHANGQFASKIRLIRMYVGDAIECDMADGNTWRYLFKGNNIFGADLVKHEPVRFGQRFNGKKRRCGKPKRPAHQQPAEAPVEAQATATT